MAAKSLILIAIFAMASFAAGAIEEAESNTTRIEFYMHDIISGPNQTAVRVAAHTANATAAASPFSFGSIYLMDNALTDAPHHSSTRIGRAQGLYAMSSMRELSLIMAVTYSFTSGPYNGSSFSVLGQNHVMREAREMPVIGGTGLFRLARGYCLAKTASMDADTAVIGYNVTLIH